MRIATWNVNGIRARLDFVLHWLREREPDVVCLQELKVDEEALPTEELAAAGYEMAVHCQKGWNGVAILSRTAIDDRHAGLPGAEAQGARLVSGRTQGIRFVNVYVPNGKQVRHPDFQLKLDWLDSLGRWLSQNHDPDEPLVLCGDMNLAPGPLDSWDPERFEGSIFHTPEERERFDGLLRWGLHDLFRARHSDVRQYSWWDYRAGAFHKGQGLRIDFLLGTQPVLSRVSDVVIDRDYRKKKDGLTASDHAPVYADLRPIDN